MNRAGIFGQLLRKDLLNFRREYGPKFADTVIVFLCNVLIFTYFMPYEGLSSTYGSFLLVGAIGSFGLIEVVGKVSLLASDIEGDRAISQILIMPIRSTGVFLYIVTFWALSSFLLALPLFGVGKLVLWDRFDLSKVSYFRLIPMFMTTSIFFGAFALWLTGVLKGLSSLNTLWLRYIVPLWMFGTYFFSWEAAYKLSPVISYILLINPMVYVMEGMRAAALGNAGYLPFAFSFWALWAFIIACFWHATVRLKRRLDCV